MVLPNQLTVARIILTPVFMYLFLSEDVVLKQISIVVFVIAAITDWYDGWLARKFNYITNWGKFLDPLADKILTSAAFISFVMIDVYAGWMVALIISRDFIITGLRLYAEYAGWSFSTSVLAKWKTFIQMAFLYYTLMLFTLKTIEPVYSAYPEIIDILLHPDLIYTCMLIITILTVWTGTTYIFKNIYSLKNQFKINAK